MQTTKNFNSQVLRRFLLAENSSWFPLHKTEFVSCTYIIQIQYASCIQVEKGEPVELYKLNTRCIVGLRELLMGRMRN